MNKQAENQAKNKAQPDMRQKTRHGSRQKLRPTQTDNQTPTGKKPIQTWTCGDWQKP